MAKNISGESSEISEPVCNTIEIRAVFPTEGDRRCLFCLCDKWDEDVNASGCQNSSFLINRRREDNRDSSLASK